MLIGCAPAGGDLGEVISGAEVAACAGEDEGLLRFVPVKVAKGVGEEERCGAVDAVADLGSVDGDGGDAVGGLGHEDRGGDGIGAHDGIITRIDAIKVEINNDLLDGGRSASAFHLMSPFHMLMPVLGKWADRGGVDAEQDGHSFTRIPYTCVYSGRCIHSILTLDICLNLRFHHYRLDPTKHGI